MTMQKGEIILLHMVLFEMKFILEKVGFSEYFRAYDAFGVLPSQIHRRRAEHLKAVKLLCTGILRAFNVKPETIFRAKTSSVSAAY